MALIDLAGYAAGVLILLSLFPQLIKSWRTKSTADLSLWRHIAYSIGLALWVVYAVLITNLPIGLMHGAELVLVLCVLGLKLRHG